MTKDKLMVISKVIASEVDKLHEGRKTWNKLCGQWLVYGFEAKIGFGNAAALCAEVEDAYKKKTVISEVVYQFLFKLFRDNGQIKENKNGKAF